MREGWNVSRGKLMKGKAKGQERKRIQEATIHLRAHNTYSGKV